MATSQIAISLSILSSIKNAMEAVKTWNESRDRKRTLHLLDEQHRIETKKQPDVIKQATQLAELASEESLRASFERIDNFYVWYETVLDSPEFIEKEVDDVARGLIKCIGNELEHLDIINEHTPEGVLKNYWDEYSAKFLKDGNHAV